MTVLDDRTIRQALERLGDRLQVGRDVEILIVGGAAGVLTGQLPAAWTTADVDVIHCHLPEDRDAVLAAAADVGRELSLPPSWLSEDVSLYAWTLPQGWEGRRIEVARHGRLSVFAAGRLDLITMKFLAHRERDLEHLAKMGVTANELKAVRRSLVMLARRRKDETSRIAMAREYLDAWEVGHE